MATVTIPLRIGPADHGRTMTLEEFEEADFEQGYRYELARGVLEVSEIPGELHAVIVWAALRAIAGYDREHPGVIHRAGGGAEYRFRLPVMQSGRHPDVAVTLRNTPRDWRGFRPASMAFEVVSKGAEAREFARPAAAGAVVVPDPCPSVFIRGSRSRPTAPPSPAPRGCPGRSDRTGDSRRRSGRRKGTDTGFRPCGRRAPWVRSRATWGASVAGSAGRVRRRAGHSGRRVVGLREVGEGLAIRLLDRAEFRGVAAGVRV